MARPFPPLVLASSSPWRRRMLADAGIPCATAAPDVDEDTITAPDPRTLAMARARAKARAVHRPDQVTLGADQVAHLDGLAFGKPEDPADHRARLRLLRGRTHTLTTAAVLLHDGGTVELSTDTLVSFRSDLSDAELDAYVATGEGAHCAGGYRAEGLGAQLIARIDGDWWNVIGLPVHEVIGALRTLGWRPPFA